jgi:DNA-binding MarR family transcriptional regulator
MTNLVGTGAHLSSQQLLVWTSLLDALRIVESELESNLHEHHDMSHREYEVLVRVDGSGGRCRMSALARQIETSAPLITQTVRKLEDRRWIHREAAAGDRRGVDAVLTSDGKAVLAAASKPHAEIIRRVLLEPMGDDLDIIADTIGPIAEHLRMHRRGEHCDNPDCWFESR